MVDRICDNCMSRVPAGTDKCPKCGIRFENTNPGGALPNGWVLAGRYTVGRYLDIDGEGVTYSAIDGDNLQRVLVKEFMPVTLCATRDETGAILAKPGCEVLFKTTRMDYSELYSILLRMGLVEGLVQVLDVFEENNTAYAVVEKIEGPTLAEYLTRIEGPIDSDRALAMLRPILIGVDAMHSNSVIHRGICPENIILESGGTAKLTGFATLALRQQGSELKPKLYPGYSAPEQYAASEFEGRYTDVYALSAVLYRMITDEPPEAADERRLQDNMRPAKAVNKEVPTYLSAAIARAMRIIPAERIQSVPDLRLALTGEGGREAKGPLGLSKKQLIIGGVVLGVIIVAIVVILLVSIFGGGNRPESSSSSSSSQSVLGEVPNFKGRVYEEVISSSSYEDYNFAEPEEEFSPDVEKGVIISQDPKAGTARDEDTIIKFVVSKGPEMKTLPNLEHETQADAIAILEELGLDPDDDIVIMPTTNDRQHNAGTVMYTEPAANSEIAIGKDRVTLFVASEEQTIAMPSLAGWTEADAKSELSRQGVTDIKVNYIPSDGTASQPSGKVESTTPPAGEQVAPGTTQVILNVYEAYRMPDLKAYVGQPEANLENFLNDRDISWVREPVANTDSKNNGKISRIDQTRAPINSEVSSSTLVTIYVYEDATGDG